MLNPFGVKGSWFRGAIHVHSKNSDGKLPADALVNFYKSHGFDFIAITDHWVITDAIRLSRDDFLVMRGVEFHLGKVQAGTTIHLVALNIPEDFKMPRHEATPQEAIDHVRMQGGEIMVAHPYWSGLTIDDLLGLSGYLGIEVFNTGCLRERGRGFSMVHWDDLLTLGHDTLGFAVDDSHFHIEDYLGGWVMVKAPSLTQRDIMEALRSGCFYSSCGPRFLDLRLDGGAIEVTCSPVQTIAFISNPEKGKRLHIEGKASISSGWFKPEGKEKYVRVECEDKYGNRAWLNPIRFKQT